ncbi:MAG: universal stress protein [Caldilinea sp. CFX5]|nr:universal stress protein [Caldilinea sp. CFX5]
MTKNLVLIPVAGAEFSLQVLPCLRRFLNPTENRLLLLHVEPEPEPIHIHEPGMEGIDIYVDESEEALRTWFADQSLLTVRELERLGFAVETDVVFGKIVPKLEEYIAKAQVNLVAMVTHGRTGLDRILHGSIAEQLLHFTTVPLLLVHPQATNGQPPT